MLSLCLVRIICVGAYQAHTNSAAHAPKSFNLPFLFMPNVKLEAVSRTRRFPAFSGLTQHLATLKCESRLEMYSIAICSVGKQLSLGFFGFTHFSNLNVTAISATPLVVILKAF